MDRDDEAARYRDAAHQALNQLDWCVEYFRSIRKREIAAQLDKNRSEIRRTLAKREADTREALR
jgi:hypothetical protein